MALTGYITELQDFLHDSNDQMWPQPTKTRYINQARNRVAQDTYCLRQLVPNSTSGFQAVLNVEQYFVNVLPVPAGYTACNVMQLDLYFGTQRITLEYNAWRMHCRKYRTWQTFLSRPLGFTRMGAQSFFLGPTPDQNYALDVILSLLPPPLVDDTTPEPIPMPFTDLIKFWACYLCKFKEQSYAEADKFKAEYDDLRRRVGAAYMNAVVPTIYSGR